VLLQSSIITGAGLTTQLTLNPPISGFPRIVQFSFVLDPSLYPTASVAQVGITGSVNVSFLGNTQSMDPRHMLAWNPFATMHHSQNWQLDGPKPSPTTKAVKAATATLSTSGTFFVLSHSFYLFFFLLFFLFNFSLFSSTCLLPVWSNNMLAQPFAFFPFFSSFSFRTSQNGSSGILCGPHA
jgi:hypothetical protein